MIDDGFPSGRQRSAKKRSENGQSGLKRRFVVNPHPFKSLISVFQRKSDAELRSLRSTLTALREEHTQLTDDHEALSRSTSQTLSAQKSQITTLTRQVTLLQDELAEYRQIAEERAHALEALRTELDDASAANESFSQKTTDEETWAVVRAELSRQAEYMRALEAANARFGAENVALKERHASIEVLREQKRALEKKAQGAEELREKVFKLEAELDAARRERETWYVNVAYVVAL